MAKDNGKLSRDEARIQVQLALDNLISLQHAIGSKKYKKRIKKAQKLLTAGLPKKIKPKQNDPAEFTDIA